MMDYSSDRPQSDRENQRTEDSDVSLGQQVAQSSSGACLCYHSVNQPAFGGCR